MTMTIYSNRGLRHHHTTLHSNTTTHQWQPPPIVCFTDAAIQPHPARHHPRQADNSSTLQHDILIQAVSTTTLDVLYAEAQALHLAASAAKQLNLHRITFFTDNQLLVTTLQNEDPILHCSDWRIRHIISDIAHHSEVLGATSRSREKQTTQKRASHSLGQNQRAKKQGQALVGPLQDLPSRWNQHTCEGMDAVVFSLA
ncbi:hypothetical protein HU200_043397 [Digitaria exilis]|uniref:RNase H type-1 domain-containing protein n=1 Tax=Digitaria exilis TaxID=1010633 RepID=A0A835B0U4_9POAL|nr:hypothetical protein HU200_043397 [Digitaria exilis]